MNNTAIDFSACARCAGFNLRRAARAMGQSYDDALRPVGLRGTQFSVLVNVAARGPLTMTALASALGMDRTTLTRNLRPLERDGLLAVAPGPDRRKREVRITPDGRETLESAYPLWRRAQQEIVKRLGGDRFERLLVDLAALTG